MKAVCLQRESWVDRVKSFACILVVIGHFFQSMVGAGILPESALYDWFINTIYLFHVPLFFICSGYLYQKNSRVDSFSSWYKHVLKKGVSLGIPYFTFSLLTWVLKAVFSGAVNSQNSDLLIALFLSPMSPYWYLYALFFVFAVTPTFSSKKMAAVGLLSALVLKAVSVFTGGTGIYAINKILDNEIWFVLGMSLQVWNTLRFAAKENGGSLAWQAR